MPYRWYRSVRTSLAWIRTLVTVYFTVPYLQFNHTGSVFLENYTNKKPFNVNFNEAYLILKWTKIGSRILIIDVPFKFSNFYFESPDPSSDPRRRLRKFKSGFQVFCILLVFTSLASIFLHSVNFKIFLDMKLLWFLIRYLLRVGTVGTGVLKLIFTKYNPF
jgi:hypothetical protein